MQQGNALQFVPVEDAAVPMIADHKGYFFHFQKHPNCPYNVLQP
jgi:hypothetical protein